MQINQLLSKNRKNERRKTRFEINPSCDAIFDTWVSSFSLGKNDYLANYNSY